MTSETPRPTRRIALINQKGGVGKTTTTVNLAAALAEAGRTVLAVDMDPQAHASLHLGADPGEAGPTVYDLLSEEQTGDLPRKIRDNLWLIPAETDLAGAETELAGRPDRHARLARSLDSLGRRFDFVLIDCPPSLGILTTNALAAAREVVIPMQAHFLALQGVGKLLETVSIVAREISPSLRVSGIVLCMHDTQTTHSREVVADIEQFLENARGTGVPWAGAGIYQPPIRRNVKLAECPSFGQTIFDYAPWCPGANDYRRLAEAFMAEPRSTENAQQSSSDSGAPRIHVRAGADAAPAAEGRE